MLGDVGRATPFSEYDDPPDDHSSVPEDTEDTWSAPLRRPVLSGQAVAPRPSVRYSGERVYSPDATPIEALKTRPGLPLVIRIQPQVYYGGGHRGRYLAWKSVYWNLELPGLKAAQEFREALQTFFVAVGRDGAPRVQAALLGLESGQQQPTA